MRKTEIIRDLVAVDTSPTSRQRVLKLENEFRRRVAEHLVALPPNSSIFESFSTSPFVLAIYSKQQGFTKISQVEQGILPAKLFSSMETSAGKMVEEVTLPIYGWSRVPSAMHTSNSALDGIRLRLPRLCAATLKSGPACLNDEMSENFADAVIAHANSWLNTNQCSTLDFTYGVLYGTKKQSNKKDWHILRNLYDKLGKTAFSDPPIKKWTCDFQVGGQDVSATIRVGKEWWEYLGGPLCLMEVCIALIRSCVTAGVADPTNHSYMMSDMGEIVKTPTARQINVGLLQQSQVPWLFLLMRHYCDELV